MLKQLYLLLKKDLKLLVSGKFFIIVLSSLILYSCYINFIYSKVDVQPCTIYLYDPMKKVIETSQNVTNVYSKDKLKGVIESQENTIAIDYSKGTAEIIKYETGNRKLDNFIVYFTLAQLSHNNNYQELESKILGPNNRELKLRKEMTCEVLFFEIVAVGFIGIASLLFKEKQMGVIKVYGIIPFKKALFFFSKLFIFLLSDIIFTISLIIINIGASKAMPIFYKVLPHVTILSLMMVLLGFFFVMIYKNFKQFGFAYAFIIILMTSPIYLAANTPISWKWIRYYPFYHLFMAMKNAFFEIKTNSLLYYLICITVIVILFKVNIKMMSIEFVKE